MCGICAHTRDPDGSAAQRMNVKMTHRGPDDEGVRTDSEAGVSLGARRLSIIDVAGGHQPVCNEDGTIWAVLNGEIYNHPELQQRLGDRGHGLRSRTDTEILVHLYEDVGDDLVHALDGMFAFAIWDARRQRMVVARDRFGEKPLFYWANDSCLVLASELTALRAGLPTEPDINRESVDAFFVFGYVPGPTSVINDVAQLPPGHVMTWDQSSRQLSIRRYWRPPLFGSHAVDHMDAIAETQALLERSLRGRMIADVPLGIFLSGGLDSTLIASLAARMSSRPIKTFTVGYDVGSVSEAHAARAVARAIGSDHHEVIISSRDLAASVPDVLGRLDQPIADQALIALHTVAAAARREITVAVGGEGADELFGGYPRYRWLARAETVGGLIPNRAAAGASRVLDRIGTHQGARLRDVIAPMMTARRHVDWVTAKRRNMRDSLYGPQLRSAGLQTRAPEVHVLDLIPERQPVAGAFMTLDQLRWLPDDVLQKADRATMMTSLEMRTPYLSRELAELAASIPLSMHMRDGGKYVLRRVLNRIGTPLPASRTKQAFRVPLADWIRGPLRPFLVEQLATSAAYSEGWFDRQSASRLLSEHCDGSADHSGALWPLITFACWIDMWRTG
jgi:asparagine synthase (glutamine-hydrolysing)